MIIVDTGFWVALANQNDKHHEAAKKRFSQCHEPLISTWCVVTETCYFLQSRGGIVASTNFFTAISEGLCQIFELKFHHLQRMKFLMEKHQDMPMDLADASLVVLAEEYKQGRILTLDIKNFGIYQWNNKYFEFLFFPKK